jgi:aspartate racemase
MARQKIIGLIGGLSWESSAVYYRLINEEVRRRLGGVSSARCLLWSFDFAEIEALQAAGDWETATTRLIDAARRLEAAGVDLLLICSNTMHQMAEAVRASVRTPLLHIVDPTGQAIQARGLARIGLLGTAFTMEQGFYAARLADQFGLEVMAPGASDRAQVHGIIYDELVQGVINPKSQADLKVIIDRLLQRGAEGVILGCTELMLLTLPTTTDAPLFDTTAIHAKAAVRLALGLDDNPKG